MKNFNAWWTGAPWDLWWGFCRSFSNPVHERMIKQIIEEEYPEDYLGSMPVILSSDVSPKSAEYTRFNHHHCQRLHSWGHGGKAEQAGQ